MSSHSRIGVAFLDLLWSESTTGAFEALIKATLQGEAVALDPERISTLPIPLPEPAYWRLREIAELFNSIGIHVIDARSASLRLDWEPPDPPDPPNLRRRAANSLQHALLLEELLGAKIERARLLDVIQPEWADELARYHGCISELISAIPINLP